MPFYPFSIISTNSDVEITHWVLRERLAPERSADPRVGVKHMMMQHAPDARPIEPNNRSLRSRRQRKDEGADAIGCGIELTVGIHGLHNIEIARPWLGERGRVSER